jgi:CheY-like chemotaxis protein
MFNWFNWFKEIFGGIEESKASLPQKISWEKYMRTINNTAYIKYPPGDQDIHYATLPFSKPFGIDGNYEIGSSGYERAENMVKGCERGGRSILNVGLRPEFIVNIFKGLIDKYPDMDRVIVEIFENIKDVKGYLHELCTISFTSTMENLKSLNWQNLSSNEVMQNIGALSNMNGIDRPFSSQYLYPDTLGEKTISSFKSYDFNQMDPFVFEDLIKMLLSKMGFEVTSTSKTVDGGIDLIAINRAPVIAGKYVIQCKKYALSNKVGEPVIRDLYGVVNSENANKGILVTTSSFSSKAVDFADKKPIELIDGQRLRSLLEQYGLNAAFLRNEQAEKEPPKAEESSKVFQDVNSKIKAFKPLNILVVDDEPSMLESFKMILRVVDQNVSTAADAYKGLEMLEQNKYDLIFHDIRLPGMDGFEALKIIKQKYPDVKVVIETTYFIESYKKRAFELGAYDFIGVPFLMEQIYDLVLKVLEEKGGEQIGANIP